MSGSIAGTRLWTTNHAANGGASVNSESVAFDAARNLLFVMGSQGLDALNAADGSLVFGLSKAALEAAAGVAAGSLGTGNSVAASGDRLALAFDGGNGAGASQPGANGYALLYTLSGADAAGAAAAFSRVAQVGAVPDMVAFAPDGSRALVAIEGEPTPGYASDAPGGLTVLDTATWAPAFFGFGAFDAQAAALRAAGVKLSNAIPGAAGYNAALPSVDLEPEHIAVSADGTRAFVTLQENNAVGVFDLAANAWTAVLPLGLANHSLAGRGIDTSDRDGGPLIRQAPVFGMHQPDGIASFQQNGVTYLVTANEGDAREHGGAFNEAVRVSALVPAAGNPTPAGMPALSPSLLAAIQPRRGDADLGRLEVTRWAGDTNSDGLLDQLQAFGGRSFSVWQVGGTASAPTLTQTFDSRQLLDQITASRFPKLYDDLRSDNKGAEPENITLGTIDGVVHAFVGLERANANMVFRVEGPSDVRFVGSLSNVSGVPIYNGGAPPTGDVAPETSVFLPAAAGQPARLAVANEVSGTTTVYTLAPTPPQTFTLQILHGSDFEAGLLAAGRARQFAAIVDRLEDATAAGASTINASITLSGGDNFLPGPFAAAGTDPSVIPVLRAYYERAWGLPEGSLASMFGTSPAFFSADIAMLNAIGVEASALGNHDFDLGTNALNAVAKFSATGGAGGLARVTNPGANFPYLSANLDFSADPNIRGIVTQTLREASTYRTDAANLALRPPVADPAAALAALNQAITNANADAQIAPWTTITEGGQTVGVLGATTQILAQISSPGATTVIGGGGADNMDQLASVLQPYVDQMQAQGINKIVLLSHLQQYQNELLLATKLQGVDVIVAAGSHALFDNPNFPNRPGDTPVESYPQIRLGADGNPVLVVSTPSEYAYVGRLVATFDANGVLVPDPDGAGGPLAVGAVDTTVSGEIVTTDAQVAALWGNADAYAPGTRGFEVGRITDAVTAVMNAKDGNLFGFTDVFLEGRRNAVRAQETNLGDLTADANLFAARQADAAVQVSIKNGGGIRAEIGSVTTTQPPAPIPPLANPAAGKPAGAISQLDIENSLRFNNTLSVVSLAAASLELVLEHAVSAFAPGATPGGFGQFGGISFSFDPTAQAQIINPTTGVVSQVGNRVQNAVIVAEDGSVADTLVRDGAVVGDPGRAIKVVTLNFLAGGGDGYPFPALTIPGSRVDLLNNLPAGAATFAAPGSEQDALAEFLLARHGTPATAFDAAETPPSGDLRVQNLAVRADTVGNPFAQVTVGGETDLLQLSRLPAGGAQQFRFVGTDAPETIAVAGRTNDEILGLGGDDRLFGNAGDDALFGNLGNDSALGGDGDDALDGGPGDDLLDGGAGDDTASYALAAEGVRVSLALTGPQSTVGAGNDTLRSVENLAGSAFADTLIGDPGANVLRGGAGNDRIAGGGGADSLDGGAGSDDLRGGAGGQELRGGAGDDLLFGGAGADRFVFGPADGNDRVADFLRAQGDRIVLEGGTRADLSLTATGFAFGATAVQVVNVPALQLSDFLFA